MQQHFPSSGKRGRLTIPAYLFKWSLMNVTDIATGSFLDFFIKSPPVHNLRNNPFSILIIQEKYKEKEPFIL